ncbi:GTP-binding protein [Alkaliphilus oremlandii]|uniref:CobW/HypB/UreG nucleotide-binding domain-containing protein n=1 Tax=Alkaliphilus oremlandii (strain OhILAs) TaxID=350688 RepID=A8MKW8_ALKOO|nr:GTP-binding protein [Alkaliphilus oremlandii]ABW17785.1 conserved hypothetical protein [Alkaliphilus oremlandii OhILAs]
MKIVTVSGPPSSGKTSITLKVIEILKREAFKIGVVKFDSLSTYDDILYEKTGVKVKVGLSGNLCPDHFYISNIEDCVQWGISEELDMLISESAGLCNRCSPHIKDVLSICVIDNLSGVNTPKKIGPMLKLADIVVITKGDIVSQAEREVFAFRVKQANPRASIIFINGITGQGSYDLAVKLKEAKAFNSLENKRLRFSMPSALCSYCVGETRIGEEYQSGNIKKMKI